MWRSLSFVLYVGSSSASDFPQIGFYFVLAPKGSAGVGGALENAEIAAGACWALEIAVPSLEIVARACSSRTCARNRSSDLFRRPHASNAVPRDCSRSRRRVGKAMASQYTGPFLPKLFYVLSLQLFPTVYHFSTNCL